MRQSLLAPLPCCWPFRETQLPLPFHLLIHQEIAVNSLNPGNTISQIEQFLCSDSAVPSHSNALFAAFGEVNYGLSKCGGIIVRLDQEPIVSMDHCLDISAKLGCYYRLSASHRLDYDSRKPLNKGRVQNYYIQSGHNPGYVTTKSQKDNTFTQSEFPRPQPQSCRVGFFTLSDNEIEWFLVQPCSCQRRSFYKQFLAFPTNKLTKSADGQLARGFPSDHVFGASQVRRKFAEVNGVMNNRDLSRSLKPRKSLPNRI